MVKTRSMIHNELMINSDIVTNNTMPKDPSKVVRPSERTYKSIIRTRSQKLREHEAILKQLFSDCDMFYSKYKREPVSTSKDVAELRLSHFLQSLRFAISEQRLTEQSVQTQLSWFKYEQKVTKTWSFGDVMLATLLFGLFPATLLCAQYYTVKCLTNSYCMERVIDYSQMALTTVGGTFVAIDRQLIWVSYELYSYFSQLMTWMLEFSHLEFS